MALFIRALILACLYCTAFCLTLESVDRHIDLTSQLSRHTINFELNEPAKEFEFLVPPELAAHLSWISAKSSSGTPLDVGSRVEKQHGGYTYLSFSIPINGKAVTVECVYTHTMQPYPREILQHESQLVLYTDNHYVFSGYHCKKQTTTVKLPTVSVEHYSRLSPSELRGDTITYGPYNKVKPYAVSLMKLHFENNRPFLAVRKMVKEIEVSHWGNVAVEETYEVEHTGAALKGPFSRVQRYNPAAARDMILYLPPYASDIYYRDEIGNISSSHTWFAENYVKLELAARYLMFGGWNTEFYMGYNLPLEKFLFQSSEDATLLMLNITVATHIEAAAIDHLTVRVILPEGSSDVELITPFDVITEESSLLYTYLDTTGRPAIQFSVDNIVSEHNRYFQVIYRSARFSMLREPLILIAGFLVICLTVMGWSRLDLSIGKAAKTSQNIKQGRLRQLLRSLNELHEKFETTIASASQSITATIQAGNTQQYKTKTSNLEFSAAALRKKFQSLALDFDTINKRLGERVRYLDKKLQEKLDILLSMQGNDFDLRRKSIAPAEHSDKKKKLEASHKQLTSTIEDMVVELSEDM